MTIMTHNDEDGKGANKFTYCKETKQFNLYLACGFWGENLTFISGAAPPAFRSPSSLSQATTLPASPQSDDGQPAELPAEPPIVEELAFDIVSMQYVNRADAAAWTLERARSHFGEY